MNAIDNTNLLQLCNDCGAVGFIPAMTYSIADNVVTVTNASTIPAGDTLRLIKIKVHDFFGNTVVGGVSLITGGQGYKSAPTVTILGDGTGATAHAVLTGDKVTSVVVDTGGSGYTAATVVFSGGGGGFGAEATATVGVGAVTAIAVAAPGANTNIDITSLNKSKQLAITATIITEGGIIADGGAYGILTEGDIANWDVQKYASPTP